MKEEKSQKVVRMGARVRARMRRMRSIRAGRKRRDEQQPQSYRVKSRRDTVEEDGTKTLRT